MKLGRTIYSFEQEKKHIMVYRWGALSALSKRAINPNIDKIGDITFIRGTGQLLDEYEKLVFKHTMVT